MPFEAVHARVEFLTVPAEGVRVGELSVRAWPVRHPGGAVGFRVTPCNGDGSTLVYVPDNELDPDVPYDAPPDWRPQLLDFIRGAEVLVHDAMYGAEEYPVFRGWGHSTVEEAVMLAAEAGVPRLFLFHHRPERSDGDVDALLARGRDVAARLGARVEVAAAAEGFEVQL